MKKEDMIQELCIDCDNAKNCDKALMIQDCWIDCLMDDNFDLVRLMKPILVSLGVLITLM